MFLTCIMGSIRFAQVVVDPVRFPFQYDVNKRRALDSLEICFPLMKMMRRRKPECTHST